MTEFDVGKFEEWFDVLAVTHRLQAKPELLVKMRAEYFAVLQPYSFEAVESAYQSLRRKMKKWPVPADWLEALPLMSSVDRLPVLTAEELAQNDEAERLGYERPTICACAACRAADVHLPSRYVPQLDRDGHEIARRHPTRAGKAILLGRWLHGHELKRWYAARAKFYELKTKIEAAQKAQHAQTPEERMARLVQISRGTIAGETA